MDWKMAMLSTYQNIFEARNRLLWFADYHISLLQSVRLEFETRRA